jgi:hypothetical protein
MIQGDIKVPIHTPNGTADIRKALATGILDTLPYTRAMLLVPNAVM